MSKTLFEITEEMAELERLLDAHEDEDDIASVDKSLESLLAWMTDITEQREAKIDAYAWIIREAEARERACRKVEFEFGEKARQAQKRVSFMKERLIEHMNVLKKRTLVTEKFRFSIQSNGGQVPIVIDDPDKIPEELKNAPPAVPDKSAIRLMLEKSVDVPGARFGTRGVQLRIR